MFVLNKLSPIDDVDSELEEPALPAEQGRSYVPYLIAIGAVAAAALVAWGARAVLIADALGVICVAAFAAATLITAWIAGVGPGVAATVLGALTLASLFSAPGHLFTSLPQRDNAIIVASTALSALIVYVVTRMHASRAALMRGLPAIERRARDRANEAARARIEDERRLTADAKADVADLQSALRQRDAAAKAATAKRADYLSAARQAVRLPLHAMEQYTARDEAVRCQQHVGALLDRLLDPVRVEAARVMPMVADVSLPEVMADTAALVEADLTARGSTLEFEAVDLPNVRGDPVILKQVLAQLLLDDARIVSRRAYRLRAEESEGGVSLTAEASGGETQYSAEREEPYMAVSDLVRQMGGRLEMDAAPGQRFTLWLPTRSASQAEHLVGPVMLWPPIAFEFPL